MEEVNNPPRALQGAGLTPWLRSPAASNQTTLALCILSMHTWYVSVREALLALLVDGQKHGYQLKTEFDEATGSTWALNVGQVYTTLQRLERDELVEPSDEKDDEGRISYELTDAGRVEVERWLTTPSSTQIASRDEASMRVLLSLATGAAPVLSVLSSQRDAAMSTLQTLTAMKTDRQKAGTTPAGEMAWRLQLDRMIFLADAEIRWLDLTESRLAAVEGVSSKTSDSSSKPERAESDQRSQKVKPTTSTRRSR